LIRKVISARNSGSKSIEVWGTGAASREFLFVQDAADAIVLATEYYDKPAPVNVGSGNEITIRELVRTICDMCGYQGNIHWNTERPDGQPRRCLDVSRAATEFGFRAKTSFSQGLAETIAWYEQICQR